MLTTFYDYGTTNPFIQFGKDSKGVDKGTSRETPDSSGGGARPPRKDEYNEKDEPQTEEVDNEKVDQYKKNRRTELDKEDVD